MIFEPDISRINQSLGSIYHCFVYYSNPPVDLQTALLESLPHLEPDSWIERLEWGGVYINGKVVYQNCLLKAPLKIEYYEPRVPISEQHSVYPTFSPSWIIYQDEYLAVCYKPPGLSCQKAKEQQKISLYHYLTEYFAVPVHLPSRLDFSTSGLVLCSINPNNHDRIQQLFVEHQVAKKYVLEIDQLVEWQDKEIELRIARDRRHPVLRQGREDRGKVARTKFTLLQSLGGKSLIQAEPLTGRTHQLRVHALYGLGRAIIGDNFYSGFPAKDLHLCSYEIAFRHPYTNQEIRQHLPRNLLPDWMQGPWIEKLG